MYSVLVMPSRRAQSRRSNSVYTDRAASARLRLKRSSLSLMRNDSSATAGRRHLAARPENQRHRGLLGLFSHRAANAFNRHRERFEEGKHYYRLTHAQAVEFIQLHTGREVSPNGITFLTQRGYLMIAKVFDDDQAWRVQEEMSDMYFAVTFPFTGVNTCARV